MAVRKSAKGAALKRWFKEDWRTPRGNKDYSKGENTFRPTKRVTKDTPSTWSELSPSEKARAKKEKNTKGRVSRYKKKYGGAVAVETQGCGCPFGMQMGPNNVL
tara:strand:- start:44 stop:355 length:312 start_codon:yes stop_codon:yes gene_type:complete